MQLLTWDVPPRLVHVQQVHLRTCTTPCSLSTLPALLYEAMGPSHGSKHAAACSAHHGPRPVPGTPCPCGYILPTPPPPPHTQAYRLGDWQTAQRKLESCRTGLRDAAGGIRIDGPSDVLLNVMAEHDYVAPPTWRGYRELTEK